MARRSRVGMRLNNVTEITTDASPNATRDRYGV
jgi:hypothetical protein